MALLRSVDCSHFLLQVHVVRGTFQPGRNAKLVSVEPFPFNVDKTQHVHPPGRLILL